METNSEVLDKALLAAVGLFSLDSSLSILSDRFPDDDCSNMTRSELITHLIALGANPNTLSDGSGDYEEAESALYKAAANGDVESVKALLSAGANIEYGCPEYGFTPLHGAALFGKHCVFRPLVEGGADLEAGSHNSGTPLSAAAIANDCKSVMVLLELGADANPAGDSPFDLAFESNLKASLPHGILGLARNHPRELILKLLSWATQNDLISEYYFSPITEAIETGLESKLTRLLIDVGVEIDSEIGWGAWLEGINNKGWTPLMAAVAMASPNVEVVSYLLSHGADVNARTSFEYQLVNNATCSPSDHRTPLHLAAEHCKDPEIIRLLLENGADVMAETADSWETPCDIGSPIDSVQALLVSAELSCREEIGMEDETTQFLRGWKSAIEADDASLDSKN